MFFEDIGLALLVGVRVLGDQAGRQCVHIDHAHLPAPRDQALLQADDDLRHRSRVFGGDVEILVQALDETVRLDGVPAGKDEREREPMSMTAARSRRRRPL